MTARSRFSAEKSTQYPEGDSGRVRKSDLWFRERRYQPLQRYLSDPLEYGKPVSTRRTSLPTPHILKDNENTVGTQTKIKWRRSSQPATRIPSTAPLPPPLPSQVSQHKPIVRLKSYPPYHTKSHLIRQTSLPSDLVYTKLACMLVNDVKYKILTDSDASYESISWITDDVFWQGLCKKHFGICSKHTTLSTWYHTYNRAIDYVDNVNGVIQESILKVSRDSRTYLSRFAYNVGKHLICYHIKLLPNTSIKRTSEVWYTLTQMICNVYWTSIIPMFNAQGPMLISHTLMRDLMIPNLNELNIAFGRVLIPQYDSLNKRQKYTKLSNLKEYKHIRKLLNSFVNQLITFAHVKRLEDPTQTDTLEKNILNVLKCKPFLTDWLACTFPMPNLIVDDTLKNDLKEFRDRDTRKLKRLHNYIKYNTEWYKESLQRKLDEKLMKLNAEPSEENEQAYNDQLEENKRNLEIQRLRYQNAIDNYQLIRKIRTKGMWKEFDKLSKVELKKLLGKRSYSRSDLYTIYIYSTLSTDKVGIEYIMNNIACDSEYLEYLNNDPDSHTIPDVALLWFKETTLKFLLKRCVVDRLSDMLLNYISYKFATTPQTEYDLQASPRGSEIDDREWDQSEYSDNYSSPESSDEENSDNQN